MVLSDWNDCARLNIICVSFESQLQNCISGDESGSCGCGLQLSVMGLAATMAVVVAGSVLGRRISLGSRTCGMTVSG